MKMNPAVGKRIHVVVVAAIFGFIATHGLAASPQDFTAALMQSTFQIVGPSQSGTPGESITGTVFILGKPVVGRPNATS